MNGNCAFCDPDDSRILFRDDRVCVIWSSAPVSDGHALIVTERHVRSWFDATESERTAIFAAIERCRDELLERFAPSGFNISVDVGKVAGQAIPHLHVHLIPRYVGDVPGPRCGIRRGIPGCGESVQSQRPGADLLEGPASESLLVCGGDDPLLPQLQTNLDTAVAADLAVAFIMKSGVSLLRDHFIDLIARHGRLRIVTGDYLDATDPDALVQLLDLGDALDLWVFETTDSSFHPKTYLFYSAHGEGTAFVGSSNLTSTALRTGIEWNYRVLTSQADQGFADVVQAFEDLLLHPQTRRVDFDWIDAYRKRRGTKSAQRVIEVVEEPSPPPPEPHSVQREALAALITTRQRGNEAGLVVLATGLGKTWLAAFDSASGDFQRVLFVAHREEILAQAMRTFRRIRPLARLGRYTGREKSPDADILFASIQTLGRARHLREFSPTAFDYIVVDEFHHAAARTYRGLIEHFSPRFLLGLTATPERTDGGDLLALCQENLVFRKDLVAGIQADLLCPFEYYGVPDDVNYSNIPWRSSRFDEEQLTAAVATNRRAQNALEQFRERGGKRTLGFCCSQRHADFMAAYFEGAGVRAVAVHAGETSSPRATALEALADGRIEVVFAVDMFNEGLDIPNVDTILMLRPTESSVIWLQQFGRGLRKASGKDSLTVIDYIGNHRTFLVKVRSLLQPLLGAGESDADISRVMRLLQQGHATLPVGCHVTYELETINIIQSLLRTRPADDAIITFCDGFLERHGVRATAVELYHAGYNPRSLRKTHGAWVRFLRTMETLSMEEREVVDAVGDFLEIVEKTPMTKSYKMLTLLSMLNEDALPGSAAIEDLTARFGRIARKSATLRADVGDPLEDEYRLRALIEKNPIDAWCGAKGTGGRRYFSYEDGVFRSELAVPSSCRSAFQDLLREIVDWRLAEYLDRNAASFRGQFVCRVIHAGGRPILKFPSRTTNSGVPSGWTRVSADGRTYVANFVKEFVNVLRTELDSKENVLSDVLRSWFGPDAGRPGTHFEVSFEPDGVGLRMEPVGVSAASTPKAEIWNHYMRKNIPPLFSLEFTQGRWNQGFVPADKLIFLLVTLEKSGLNKEHRYDDKFLSALRFQWQSQNQTKQDSKYGRMIRNHKHEGVDVHLFVRKHKLLDKKAAPFVYCGQVEFESWKGETPISVVWKLREPVPSDLSRMLDVPVAGEDSGERGPGERTPRP